MKKTNDVTDEVAQQERSNNKYYVSTFRYIYIYSVGPKNLKTSAHFILGPIPAPRKEKQPRTDKESPNGLETLPRTILLSASQIPRGKNSIPAKVAPRAPPGEGQVQ